MSKRVCVVIKGQFYESYRKAGRKMGCDTNTVIKRCSRDTFPEYTIFFIPSDKKRCHKCGGVKLLSEFDKNLKAKDGCQGRCKVCRQKDRDNRKGERGKYDRQRYLDNKEGIKEKTGQYRCNHREETNVRIRKRYRSEIKYKINDRMGSAIRQSLKNGKNGHHWEDLVGYTLKELMAHLEMQFIKGMSWDNYGEWHIDHIIPISKWDIISYGCKGFRGCWSLNNLQPLWAVRNLQKGDKPMEPKYLIN